MEKITFFLIFFFKFVAVLLTTRLRGGVKDGFCFCFLRPPSAGNEILIKST